MAGNPTASDFVREAPRAKLASISKVDEDRRELFSNAILNLLLEEEVLSTSGKTLEELFERVYENIVQEKEIDEVISVETTFEQLCRNPGKRITTESVEEGTLQALEKAKRCHSSKKMTQNYHKKRLF